MLAAEGPDIQAACGILDALMDKWTASLVCAWMGLSMHPLRWIRRKSGRAMRCVSLHQYPL
ncbi:MAG: hypothetical protein ACPIOQ_01705 [Promethearchaeia archaeon]